MIVTLGRIIKASSSNDILGLSPTNDRDKIIDYINRAIEIAAYKANWNCWVSTLDVCSDGAGYVTMPYFVGTVLAMNIGGCPALFRNSWYEYHVNGVGSDRCGNACGCYWDDKMWTPVFQDLRAWSVLAAIVEDPIDGDGSLELIVQGETMDASYNQKEALTIPGSGPSYPGVRIPLRIGVASTDPAITFFKKITQVTKPVTRGYVKLIGFPPEQLASAVTLGYYAPNETNPTYRRYLVGATCSWVRVKFRRQTLALVNDYDIVPLGSFQATLDLLKAIRLRETNNIDVAQKYEEKAVELLSEIQSIEDGPNFAPMQFEPGFGVGTLDWR